MKTSTARAMEPGTSVPRSARGTRRGPELAHTRSQAAKGALRRHPVEMPGSIVAAMACFACLDLDVRRVANHAPVPVVSVDPAEPVHVGATVTLDGSATMDPDPQDARAVRVRWEQVAGDRVDLDDPVSAVAHFTAPRVPQTLLFVLGATDGIETATSSQVRVVVRNAPPSANATAIPSEPVVGGTTITLDGAGSTDPDPEDSGTLTFLWQQVPGTEAVVLDNPASPTAHFTAPRRPQTLLFTLQVSDGVDTVTSAQVPVVVTNNPPVASAGARPAGPVVGGTTVTLDGSASSDADPGDGARLAFRWQQVAGTDTVRLDDPAAPVARFEAPRRPQSLFFVLHVSDGVETVDSAQVVVDVVNTAPSAAALARPPGAVTGETVVTLDGTGSADADPGDAARLTYRWQQVAGIDPAVLDAPSAAVTHFTAPRRPQVLLFVLQVSDGLETAESGQVQVDVVNHPPAARAGAVPAEPVTGGTTVTLDGSATADPDPGDSARLTFRWEQVAGADTVVLDAPDAAIARFETPRRPQTLLFVLHASDGLSETTSQVAVRVFNTTPAATARAEPEGAVHGGTAVALNGSASTDADPGDAGRLAFRWEQVAGADAVDLEDAASAVARFTAPRTPQALLFTLRVSDGVAESLAQVRVVVVNAAPTAAAHADPAGPVAGGTVVTLDGSASTDPDPGDPELLSYRWQQVSGTDAVVLDSPAAAVAHFAAPRAPQTLLFSLRASDGVAESLAQVRVVVVNAAPVAAARADPAEPVTGGAVVTLDGSASADPDPGDSDRLSWRWQQVAGTDAVVLDTSAAAVAHFVAPRAPQVLLFSLHVSDGVAESTAQARVVVVNSPPVPAVKVDPAGAVPSGRTVTLDASATADRDPGDAPLLSYRWEQMAGAAVALSGLTDPVVRFTAPRGVQTLGFLLRVSDGFHEAVQVAAVDVVSLYPPTARAGADQVVRPGASVTLDGSGSDDRDLDPLSFLWTQTAGPAVALSGATTARAAFEAPAGAGRLEFRLAVSDGSGEGTDEVAVEVAPPPVARVTAAVGSAAPVDATGRTFAVYDGDRVVLDSSGSVPPAGGAITAREWSIPPELALANPGLEAQLAQPALSFLVPARAVTLMTALRVSSPSAAGGTTQSEEARTTFVVELRPVARPGPAREVLNRTPLRLDALQSEGVGFRWRVLAVPPGGECCRHDAAGCAWEAADPLRACLSGETTPTPVFTPFARGDYTLELVVRNAAGSESLPAFTLVSALNNPPRAQAGRDLSTPNHGAVELRARYTDLDDDDIDPMQNPRSTVRWEVRSVPAGATFDLQDDPDDGLLHHFTPHGKGTYFLTLVVGDGVADSPADELAVVAENLAPTAAPPTRLQGFNRAPIPLSAGTSSDPDGDALAFAWTVEQTPAGAKYAIADAFAGSTTFTPDGRGTWTLRLVASDGTVASAPADVSVEVHNNPPVADPGRDVANHSNASLMLDGSRSFDPDDDAIVSWKWRQLAGPALASLTGTGSAVALASLLEGGLYRFGLVVGDGRDLSAEASVAVFVPGLNQAPFVDAGPDQVVEPGSTVTLSGSANDPEGDVVRGVWWTRESGPDGLPQQLAGAEVTFTAPARFDLENLANNRIEWRLRASDSTGAVSTGDTVVVHVGPESSRYVVIRTEASDTATCGAIAAPCATVRHAVGRASGRAPGSRNVVLLGGIHDLPVRTLVVPPGVRLYGGFVWPTFERDIEGNASVVRPWSAATGDPADDLDNDCDGSVDEQGSRTAELCNNMDDDEDGSVDEGLSCSPQDAWFERRSESRPLLVGRQYGTLGMCSPSNLNVQEYWFYFDLLRAMPPDPDGPGPQRAPVELRVNFGVEWTRESRVLYMEFRNAAGAVLASNNCRTTDCQERAVFVSAGLAAGRYFIRFWGLDYGCRLYGMTTWARLAVHLVPLANTVGDRNANYCSRSAAVLVSAAPGAASETETSVLDGLTISGPAGNVKATAGLRAADPVNKAVLCDQCAVRIRNSRILADASATDLATEPVSAAVYVDRGTSLVPTGSDPPQAGVVVEKSYLQAGKSKHSSAIFLADAGDFDLRDNTLVTGNPGTAATDLSLVRLGGTAGTGGSLRGHVRGNLLRIGGVPSMTGHCAALLLEKWQNLLVWNNVFRVEADCGSATGGDNYNNAAVLMTGDGAGSSQVLAHNLLLGRAGIVNRSRALATSGACTATTWLVRNNYVRDFHVGVDDCDGGGDSLVQWNAFSAVASAWRKGTAAVSSAELAGLPDGALGPRPESLHNAAATCTFKEDGRGAVDSPCLDAGSSEDTTPAGFAWPAQTLVLDAKGRTRPADLEEVPNGPGSDGTDVGVAER